MLSKNTVLHWTTMYRDGKTYVEIGKLAGELPEYVEVYITMFNKHYPLPDWASCQIYRASGLLENICEEHGVGHPSLEWLALHDPDDLRCLSVHGCCGCCRQGQNE